MATIKGIKLKIGGDTSELTNALKGVNKEIKGTQSELREVDRLLKIDPKNTELLAQKQKLLADNVENSKKKLETLKTAAEQASDQLAKGEIGDDQFRSLQREVIKAEQELKKATDTAENFGKKSKKSFEEIGGSVKGAGEKIKGISAVAGGAAAALTGMAIAGGKAADDINTLSKVAGLSTKEIQKFQYASEIVDVSVETLVGSMAKLTRNMGNAKGGTGAAYDAFETLGVSITDSSGKLRDNNDVFTEVIAKLGEVKSETDRDVLAMQLFGKSAQELNPLILGGAEDLALLGKKAEEMGLILDQDALDSANSLNDALDEMNSTVKASVLVVSSELAPILAPILEKISLAIADLANRFKNLSPEMQVTILAVLTAIGVLGPLLIIIGTVIEKVGFIVKILPTLGTAINAVFTILKANPIGVIITLIVAVIGYLVHLYNTNAEFKAKVDEVWGAVKDIISSVTESIKNRINSIVDAFRNLPSEFRRIGSNIINGIKDGIMGGINAVIGAVTGVVDKIKGVFTNKDGFDIHSPSRWGEGMSKNLLLGIGNSIKENEGIVLGSVTDLTEKMKSGLTGVDFNETMSGLRENANFVTSAEVKQEQTVFIADAVGQSLLYGLQAISEAIFDALPKDVQLNIDGGKFASYNWSYLDREGYSRGRIFAPSENTIANIARSVMPKGEEKK